MIILAIDPGLEKTGYALFNKNRVYTKGFQYLNCGLIYTPNNLSKPKRIMIIYQKLYKIINKYRPKKLIVEDIFFFKNKKTIMSIGQVHGIILLLAAKFNLIIKYLTPLQIKQAITGYGLADKKAIKKMIDMTLSINKKSFDDNVYDALACGLSYCYQNDKLIE